MAETILIPGGGVVVETGTDTILIPGVGTVTETQAAAPPAGAVMNQLQSSNVGADLYNGTLQ